MVHALLVNAIIYGLLYPTLSKHPGKPDYAFIQDTHHILTVNAASTEIHRVGHQNGYLGLVLTATQCVLVRQLPSVHPTHPG